ncbi:integrin, partial [Staphylococcus aureus]|nr:integrin [Staphylococcus aureus]
TDNDCSNAGAVYVFTRSGATWALEAYVKAPNAEAYDLYGESASVSGDKLAIGTRGEASCSTGVNTTAATDNNCYSVGAAYVFTRS